MKILSICIVIAILVASVCCAKLVALPAAEKKEVSDDSELVKLAEEEKFVIPLNGRTISHSI